MTLSISILPFSPRHMKIRLNRRISVDYGRRKFSPLGPYLGSVELGMELTGEHHTIPHGLLETSLQVGQLSNFVSCDVSFFSYHILNFSVEFFLNVRMPSQMIQQP